MYEFETLLVERRDNGVAIVTLNRPDRMNTMNLAMKPELADLFGKKLIEDRDLRCVIVTGAGDRAFCAGADIKEMSDKPAADFYLADFFAKWTSHIVEAVRKPWIAAVNGFALGGGCELAMMADFIIASEKAKFGQPEIKLGVAPGMGGSQRLTRAVGKAKAMEMCLTGRMMDAEEAERSGLVARVVPHDTLMDEARTTAATIAGMPPMAAMVNKEMVNAAYETFLGQGVLHERRLFQILTATEDKAEGMKAFIEKRDGQWKGR